tara:strand:+ start:68772 stop:69281 length:510 start_codon:yes stop_codon:yes gene_type:complete
MKLLKSLFVLFVAVSLLSCSSDDDSNQYEFNNANLSGTYTVTMLNSTEIQTTNVNGLDVITEYTTVGDTFQLTIVFSASGSYVIDGEYRDSYIETVAGQVQDEGSEIVVIDNATGNYSTNNSTMTFVMDGEVFSVALFNANELRITSEDIYVESGDEFVYTSEIRMVRQ